MWPRSCRTLSNYGSKPSHCCRRRYDPTRMRTHGSTPDGSLFNEDPRQPGNRVINSLRVNALTSGSFTNALLDSQLLDVVEQMLGHNIELWKWGQCVYKQPHTGVPKSLHQDGYYFEHRHQSPIAVLTYAINVDQTNGPLFVIPGSHQLGIGRACGRPLGRICINRSHLVGTRCRDRRRGGWTPSCSMPIRSTVRRKTGQTDRAPSSFNAIDAQTTSV